MTRNAASAMTESGGFFADLPVARKILAGFGAIIALLVLVGGIAFWSMVTISGESDHYEHAVH